MNDMTQIEVSFLSITPIYNHNVAIQAERLTLSWVNARRATASRPRLSKLPRGVRYSIRHNPVARALGKCNVGLAALTRDGETDMWVIPDYAIRFLQLFHDGYLPDFEKTDHRASCSPYVRRCKKCGSWRHLKCEWPEGRVFDPQAICLICDPSGMGRLKDSVSATAIINDDTMPTI